MKLRIHRFLPHSTVEGPGKRAVLWVQGCPIRCDSCAVPWTWPADGGEEAEVAKLFQEIQMSFTTNGIEGVTFLGGEPFEQAEALAELGRLIKGLGLTVMTFSGYTMEHITASNRLGWQELISITDLFIDGPFIQEKLDLSRPWVGSSNQRYHFLTPAYRSLEEHLHTIPNRVEVRFESDGTVSVNGMITQDQLRELTADYLVRKNG